MQFVNGFHTLRQNGVLSAFASTHHLEGIAFEDIHKTSEFFFWHSYFVWELESQFRALGGDYSCFAMPYWDFTVDAEYLALDASSDALPVFTSLLGSDGNPENNHCVEDELWNSAVYGTEFLCAPSETSPNCCLKRQRNDHNDAGLANKSEITSTFYLERFRSFQDLISVYHGKIHKFFAAGNTSHMWSNNAAEDPLFVLVHSFVDYIRAMRQDCWDYDRVDVASLDELIPFAFDGYQVDQIQDEDDYYFKPTLDTKMSFVFICTEVHGAYCREHEVTIRSMFDIGALGISYEPGSFWSDNAALQEWCGDRRNDSWFYEESQRESEVEREHVVDGAAANGGGVKSFGWLVLLVVMYVLIGVVVFMFCMYVVSVQYISSFKSQEKEMQRKLIDDHLDNEVYGSV